MTASTRLEALIVPLISTRPQRLTRATIRHLRLTHARPTRACSIHDRKLYVLGWCVLMQLQSRPPAVDTATSQILPAMVVILHGLKRAYEGGTSGEVLGRRRGRMSGGGVTPEMEVETRLYLGDWYLPVSLTFDLFDLCSLPFRKPENCCDDF